VQRPVPRAIVGRGSFVPKSCPLAGVPIHTSSLPSGRAAVQHRFPRLTTQSKQFAHKSERKAAKSALFRPTVRKKADVPID